MVVIALIIIFKHFAFIAADFDFRNNSQNTPDICTAIYWQLLISVPIICKYAANTIFLKEN